MILQHQDIDNGYYRSLQTLFYHSRVYVRFVWFTDSTRTVLLENANFNSDWWETSISHLEYDETTHTIKCRRIGQNVNSTKWITLPSASTSTDGLMTKEQVKSLDGKQDKLNYYIENTSTDTAVIKVSHDTDEATVHEDKVEVGTDNCVLLKSEDVIRGEDSYIKVSHEKVSMSSPEGEIEDVVKVIQNNADTINNLYECAHSELIEMRNSGNLIVNRKYCIIDYVTTTTQDNTRSANHKFDIVVTATSNNTLSEDVKIIRNIDDNDYFAQNDLSAWVVKYCVDNDTSRFSWADTVNGKGVIYYLKDEFNNEC